LSSGLKALESVGATRFGAHDAPNRRRIIEAGAIGGLWAGSVHLELRRNRMGLAQHQMPLIGIPGNATGLVFGKEVQQALGSFWYLLGTAECGAMSETRKLAAILAADVVG
jgi:hypothetical protein